MYELRVNGELIRKYETLRGVQIAYGRYSRMFDRGEIIPTKDKYTPMLEFKYVGI